MRRLIALTIIALSPAPAVAQTVEYTCMDRCAALGYQYQYCQERCTYARPTPSPAPAAPVYTPSPVNPIIAQGVRPIDLSGTLATISAMQAQRAQAEAAEAQRRLYEAQAREQEAKNARAAQATAATSGGTPEVPKYTENDRVIYMRWLQAVQQRRGLYSDFDAVVFAPDVPTTMPMIDLMSGSMYAADIAYYLAKNKAESWTIANMLLLDQAVAIKEIEKKVSTKDP